MREKGGRRQFRFPWRSLGQIHREVDEELLFHIESHVEDLRRSGLDEAEARRRAHRRFGDLEGARRSLKAAGRQREKLLRRHLMVDDFLRDIRYATRSLARSPGFTLTAVVVLALGIGINSAIFSIVNMLLMRPTLVEDPSGLVAVYSQDTEQPESWSSFSYPTYADMRQQSDVFQDLAAFTISLVGVREGDTTERAMAGLVSSNYFSTLGVPIQRGRVFSAEEEDPASGAAVALASAGFARRRGGDVLGETVIVNNVPITVVGVTPEGFTGTTALIAPDLWLPLGLFNQVASLPGSSDTRSLGDRDSTQLMLFARFASGLDHEAAAPRLEALAERLEKAYPGSLENQRFITGKIPRLSLSTAPNDESMLTAPALLVMAMGGIVLLLACLNLANMYLARGATRRVELAIRLSLGGGRLRLLRQLISEGLVLSLLGGAGGLLLAHLGTRWMLASISGLRPLGISLIFNVTPDLRVFAATLAFCLLATVLAGLGPAWKLASGDVLEGLKETSGQSLSGGGRRILVPRNALVIGQIALALTLLSAGGLFMRGAVAAAQQSPGFSIERGVLAEVDTGIVGYDPDTARATLGRLMREIRAVPGVEAASFTSIVPLGPITMMEQVSLPNSGDEADTVAAHHYTLAEDYFASLDLPILRGRDFTSAEVFDEEQAAVAIIDEPLAARLWPDVERPADQALGRSVQMGTTESGEAQFVEIVGVVPGVQHQIWDDEPPPHIYEPYGQNAAASVSLQVQVAEGLGDGRSQMLQNLRETIRRVDPELPVLSLKTLEDHRQENLFLWLVSAAARFFSVIGGLALVLALVGVYGVNAFVVARRTREIGIRMALGATRGEVVGQMLRENLRLTFGGLALGGVLAWLTAKALSALIFQASGEAPAVMAVAALLLAGTATVAALVPARRAVRVEPVQALRQE
ncbi:MAG: ADOP family duplicated permease [Acidobacteriota bacterium]